MTDNTKSLWWCVNTGTSVDHWQEDKHNPFEDKVEQSWRQTYFYLVITLLGTQWNPSSIMVRQLAYKTVFILVKLDMEQTKMPWVIKE